MQNDNNTTNNQPLICEQCKTRLSPDYKPGSRTDTLLCKKCYLNSARRSKFAKSYPIICAHCKKSDTVPFKPYSGSVVLCGDCMENSHVTRVGSKIMHAILCCECGEETRVPFKPDPGSRVLCRPCHIKEREEKELYKQRMEERHPSKLHGTKVKIDITCDKCGNKDTLPYVPKTTGPVLCRYCAEHTFGEQWVQRHRIRVHEFRFNCVKCGEPDFVNFKPDPEKELLCRRCLNSKSILHADATNTKHDEFTFVRRKKIKPEDNQTGENSNYEENRHEPDNSYN